VYNNVSELSGYAALQPTRRENVMVKRTAPCLMLLFCFSIVYAQYENGGVITTYAGDVFCLSGPISDESVSYE